MELKEVHKGKLIFQPKIKKNAETTTKMELSNPTG